MWRLAINSLAGRRLRSALLIAAVAVATALIVATAASIDTLEASIRLAVGRRVGLADLRVVHQYNMHLDEALLEQISAWPQVKRAAASFETGVTIRSGKQDKPRTVVMRGIDPAAQYVLNPPNMRDGRPVQAAGEVVITPRLARRMNVSVGDPVTCRTYSGQVELTVVGIVERPRLDVMQKRMVLVTLEQVRKLATAGKLTQIDIQVHDPMQVQPLKDQRSQELAEAFPGAVFRDTAASGARINRGMRQVRLMLTVLTVLIHLSAAFIILTGLTTSVLERMRELAILRSIGAGRLQIAGAELLTGAMLAGAGAAIGLAPGLGMAYLLYDRHAKALVAGFAPSPASLLQAIGAALAAGLIGASYPAWRAAHASPVEGLAARAHRPAPIALAACALVGLGLVALPFLAHWFADAQRVFWAYIYVGLPLMFVGYFLLTVPLAVLVSAALSPVIAPLLRLPRTLLRQQMLATPFRHGFTAGALMVALAMLVGIWTAGSSMMKGWLDNLRMPDGFAHSFYGFSADQWEALKQVDAIQDACPSTAFPVLLRDVSFGVTGLARTTTLFVATDTDAFNRLVQPDWIQGDPETAARRLREGGAVLVTRQYLTAHGLGVGDTIKLSTLTDTNGGEFEIVGVVTSPGLEVAVRFFDIHRAYGDAAVASVFGTYSDATKHFNSGAINLVLLDLDDDLTDKQVIDQIREAVPGTIVGSARNIRREVRRAVTDTMAVLSTVAGAALLIACLGVGQLILASLQARWFEMGVLRTIGAGPGMLGRLVAAQTILIAMVATLAGSTLGVQIALINRLFHQRLLGLSYDPHVPWSVLEWGAAAVIVSALLAAAPSIAQVTMASPRRLLAAR